MSAEILTSAQFAESPLGHLQRLYRRICLLRAGHRHSDASQLEVSQLPQVLDAVRSSGDDARIAPLLAAEETRVAEAGALAELLAPLLAERLHLAPIASPSSGVGVWPKAPAPTAPRGSALSIADFIDGMIAQERPDRPPAPSALASPHPQPAIHRSL